MVKKTKTDEWNLTEDEWRKRLTEEQYHVLREKGTEPPHANRYNKCKEKGTYTCAACGLPLFGSEVKYDSGSGWPSFWEPINDTSIAYQDDYHLAQKRTEVLCSRCGSHLGHVFEDGPDPTGQRYCMNSTSLQFVPDKEKN